MAGRGGRPRRARAAAVPARREAAGVVDSHVHLASCAGEPATLVAEARAAGVDRMVTIGCGHASSLQAVALAERHPEVWAAVGVHPHDADGWTDADARWIRELAAHPRVVAIGECGLDHHYDRSARPAQERAFRAQIGLARECGLPVVVHTRDAADDTLRILREDADGHPVVLHCFSLPDEVAAVAAAGWYASFAGTLTFRRSDDLRAAAAALPEDRVLVETDAPYLA
ncbi:MAG TPA: TatD family hydrolase, partial [Miltoncostaeaceae bacterium]|nr:TatD family hydrolase [Miltoncostaeaceae bacterium]